MHSDQRAIDRNKCKARLRRCGSRLASRRVNSTPSWPAETMPPSISTSADAVREKIAVRCSRYHHALACVQDIRKDPLTARAEHRPCHQGSHGTRAGGRGDRPRPDRSWRRRPNRQRSQVSPRMAAAASSRSRSATGSSTTYAAMNASTTSRQIEGADVDELID